MDVRRPANENGAAEPAPVAARREAPRSMGGGGVLGKVLMVLAVLVAVSALGWFVNRAYVAATANNAVKDKQFQAVFLTNGQVYFGKFSEINNSYVKLTDIYYLQVQQTVQPKDSSSSSASNQQVSLAKLGGELHGPEDVMFISRDQVLFWENLKNSGKVVQAIDNYQSSGGK